MFKRYIQFYHRFDVPLPSYFCHGTVSPKRTRVRIDGAYLPMYCQLNISNANPLECIYLHEWVVFLGFHQAQIYRNIPWILMGWSQSPDPSIYASERHTMQLHGVILASHIASINCSSGAWILKLELGFVFDKGSPGAVERCIYSKYSKQNREEFVYIYIYIYH